MSRMNRYKNQEQWPPSRAVQDVIAERLRQVSEEGWHPDHDDEHIDGSLAQAAAVYALMGAADGPDRAVMDMQTGMQCVPYRFHSLWPATWSLAWLKPKSRRQDLVKAAALLLAEIERLDRRERKGGDA